MSSNSLRGEPRFDALCSVALLIWCLTVQTHTHSLPLSHTCSVSLSPSECVIWGFLSVRQTLPRFNVQSPP